MIFEVRQGDCVELMAAMPAGSVDAVVCDPPYGLEFMGKDWDRLSPGSGRADLSNRDNFKPTKSEFKDGVGTKVGAPQKNPRCRKCGKLKFDHAKGKCRCKSPDWNTRQSEYAYLQQVWHERWATEALRVLKPGGHLLAFGGTRTYHRLVCAVEDAGFEIRDTISWLYGSGFPKSLNVGAAIDKAAGAEREVVGMGAAACEHTARGEPCPGHGDENGRYGETVHAPATAPATPEAERWEGWGTALKPAHEPIVVGSKPLTVEQYLAIIVGGLTQLIEETAECNGVSALDVERSSSAIRAKLLEVDASVHADARTYVLASFGLASYAAPSSTCPAPESSDPTRTLDGSARSPAKPKTNAARTSGQTIPLGEAGDLLTRLLATCTSVATEPMSANIVSSWSNISAELLTEASRFTTSTATRLTTGLRTLRSFLPPSTIVGTGRSGLSPLHEPVVVARKPLSSTVAGNVLAFGTGALNIDATRVGGAPPSVPQPEFNSPTGQVYGFQAGEGRNGEMSDASGRWPANVVLSHTEGCVQVGTRKVKSGNHGAAPGGFGEQLVGGDKRQREDFDASGGYGTETVGAWSCTPDCAVRLLDEQTGELPGMARGVLRRGATTGASIGGEATYGTQPPHEAEAGYDDTGGASRFFPTFDNKHEEAECAGSGGSSTTSQGDTSSSPSDGGTAPSGAPPAEPPIDRPGPTGAERFRYVAKASRGERNAGLEGFEEQPAGGHVRSQDEGTYWEFIHPAPEGIGEWLREAREAAGLSRKDVAQHFPSRTGGLTGCVTNWEEEFNRPTPDQWRKLREVLHFDDRYDVVMTEQREVVRELFDDKPRQTARNVHPTVKPISLMRWLVRLVTPPGGTVLDPFAGSGTTGCAAVLEGFDFIGLEREPEYVKIAEARIAWWHKHRGDGEAAEILAAGEARDEVEATGQLGMFD